MIYSCTTQLLCCHPSGIKEMNIRFFTVNSIFKDFTPVTHEEHIALCLAILDDVKRQALKKYFSKYDTERYASLALFPEEQGIYIHMVAIVDRLKQQVAGTQSQRNLNWLVNLMIEGDAPGLSLATPYTFQKILGGKLKKYYPENHDESLESNPKAAKLSL